VNYDVVIVGAGPAGLSTALHLAKFAPELAARTVVLERARHPRRKLCAGGIMPGGEAWLRKLDLNIDEIPSVLVDEARFLFEGRGFVIRRRPGVFYVVAREVFDSWLANAARARGITLHEGVRAESVRVREHYVEVQTDAEVYRAQVVVGADGVNSVVRRSITHQSGSALCRLLESRTDQVHREDSNRNDPPDCAILDFSPMAQGIQGYVWSFPAQFGESSGHTVGIFDSRIRANASVGPLDTGLRECLARCSAGLEDQRVEGWPLRRFDPGSTFSSLRVLLVGDAAGVDPLLGEGISFALGYGEVAAQELVDAFKQRDFSLRSYRRHILNHRVGRFLLRRTQVAALIYRFRRRRVLRFLWWGFGPLIGKLAERFLVDWG